MVGGRGREDNDGDIPDGHRKVVGVGRCDVQQRTFSGGIRYSAAANNVNDKDNDRGGAAPPTPPSTAMSWEPTTTTTTTTTLFEANGLSATQPQP